MILLIDMNHKRDSLSKDEFVRPIASALAGKKCQVVHYLDLPDSIPLQYSKAILSGTPLKDNAYMDNLSALSWLKDAKIPVLGICAGMQAICAVFGGKIISCQEMGMTHVETTTDNPLFSGKFKAYSLHNLAIEPSGGFQTLAKSEKCIQAVKHKKLPLYGVLFHPEVRNTDILINFANL
jgi:GMP synthase-like glutamine amidotransferase